MGEVVVQPPATGRQRVRPAKRDQRVQPKVRHRFDLLRHPDRPVGDQVAGQLHKRHVAIRRRVSRLHPRPQRVLVKLPRLGRRRRQRLVTKHVGALVQRRGHRFHVSPTRRGHRDDVRPGVGHPGTPVGGPQRDTQLAGHLLNHRRCAAGHAHHLHPRVAQRRGVPLAGETGSDDKGGQ